MNFSKVLIVALLLPRLDARKVRDRFETLPPDFNLIVANPAVSMKFRKFNWPDFVPQFKATPDGVILDELAVFDARTMLGEMNYTIVLGESKIGEVVNGTELFDGMIGMIQR